MAITMKQLQKVLECLPVSKGFKETGAMKANDVGQQNLVDTDPIPTQADLETLLARQEQDPGFNLQELREWMSAIA